MPPPHQMTLIDENGDQLGSSVNINPSSNGGDTVGNVKLIFRPIGGDGGFGGDRALTLFLVDLEEFGTAAELSSATALQVAWPGGLDFAFVAANEASIPTASGLNTLQTPTGCTSGDNSALTPSPQVQVVDADGNSVKQPGIVVRAEDVNTDDNVNFSGTTEATTDDDGIATFNDLIVDNCTNPDATLSTTFVLVADGLDASAPTAANDSAKVLRNDSVTLDVLANDSFGVAGPGNVAVTISTPAGNGNL